MQKKPHENKKWTIYFKSKNIKFDKNNHEYKRRNWQWNKMLNVRIEFDRFSSYIADSTHFKSIESIQKR